MSNKEPESSSSVSSTKFEAIANAAPVMVWICDADSKCTWFNQPWLDFVGREMSQELGLGWMENIHAEDLSDCNETFQGAFDSRQAFTKEYRLRRNDGEYLWVLDHGRPWFEEDGTFGGFIGSCVDIHSQKQNEEELKRRVEERTKELENAYREMESFSYSVSHDLRAPLRSMNTNLAMLQEDFGAQLPEEAQLFMQRARDAGKRMDQLMSGILQLSRLSRKEIVPADVDISELATTVCKEMGGNCQIDPGLHAMGDVDLLRTVFENLIGNAVKYRAQTISIGKRGDAFFVRDDGVGFDMQHSDKLFKAFERLHSPTDFPGSGLGLASVKRIVERHSGSVWAEAAPNEGATFYFTLGLG